MRRATMWMVAVWVGLTATGCSLWDVPPSPRTAFGMAFNLPAADGSELPGPPAFFVRSAGSVSWAEDPIVIPGALERIDYEGELVVVIGKRAHRVSPESAKEYILGYTCGMDGSPWVAGADGEKDLLRSMAGKSVDGVAPVGPRLVPGLAPGGNDIVLRVNGQEVERANTRDLIWDPARMVSEISRTVTLERGDVIFTGARQAIPQLKAGDEVEVEIEGIGTLRRRVVAEGP